MRTWNVKCPTLLKGEQETTSVEADSMAIVDSGAAVFFKATGERGSIISKAFASGHWASLELKGDVKFKEDPSAVRRHQITTIEDNLRLIGATKDRSDYITLREAAGGIGGSSATTAATLYFTEVVEQLLTKRPIPENHRAAVDEIRSMLAQLSP